VDFLNATLGHLSALPESCGFPPFQKMVFMSTAAKVPRNDSFVAHYKDRNTNLKLKVWSEQGLAIARARGFDTVDQFRYTEAFVHDSPDQAHFLMTDAIDAILDDLIGVLGFCDITLTRYYTPPHGVVPHVPQELLFPNITLPSLPAIPPM
jgi:hypothetical protein